MDFDEISVYCEKHEGFGNCNCSKKSKHSEQTNVQVDSLNDNDERNSASKTPQIFAAVVGMSQKIFS